MAKENLRSCKRCKIIFQAGFSLQDVCPDCQKKEDEDYHKIKDYLWTNPNKNIQEVSIATGIDEGLILKFLQQKRILSK